MSKFILVVEDDDDIRDSVLELLDMEGFSSLGAENGQVALDYLSSGKKLPDLILLDLMMPVKNGFEVSEILRSGELSHLPVVVMSADGQLNAKKESLHAKAYLKKPVDITELMTTISKLLG